MESDEFKGRKAPYAPVTALQEFFDKMRNVGVPSRVDQRFLQKLNVAANNEWALLSALKFLGIVDQQGVPTHAYRLLQSSDRFQDTLRHLVETAYAPLYAVGGADMSMEDLTNYFRVTSSPSQAKNAARFFRAVSRLAKIDESPTVHVTTTQPVVEEERPATVPTRGSQSAGDTDRLLLEARARLLDKLPAPHPEWTATEYQAICDRFLDMLRYLEG